MQSARGGRHQSGATASSSQAPLPTPGVFSADIMSAFTIQAPSRPTGTQSTFEARIDGEINSGFDD
ncbi:hypothetical protein GN244_ATG03899 [Phytophthora infestans]|uniref:Uncharacterized protein n=1 Tax=Phytophthora infestans TaxID=4787 RepID=A0A833T096_PHYIN|nr:hypothetical protein GN244_ATG03899 [Phytophthora infestans]KAF4143349.1 hypothetical protein GN958_ATG07460 [Phytophthora infestans]